MLIVDPAHPTVLARVEQVHQAMVHFALARGGTCTGQHRVGPGKRRDLPSSMPAAWP